MRVLIVEDEALVADYLEALVLSFGYEVCAIAASAPEAVEDAAIHKPDVALMVRLPRGTSGIDAACEIYSSQGLRCVFLSENLDDATRRTLNLCQPIVFINKPVLPGGNFRLFASSHEARGGLFLARRKSWCSPWQEVRGGLPAG
jgi:DNA-binding NarL/FixJ family response regulator